MSSQEFESLQIQDMTFAAYRNEVYPSRYDVFYEEHAVIVVLEGEKKFTSPTQEVHVTKGDILFIQRGFYLMSESINETYKSLVFFFDEKLLKEFVGLHPELFNDEEIIQTQSDPLLLLQSDQNFQIFIQSVFPYFRSKTALKNHFLKLKFQELLLHLLEVDAKKQLQYILYTLNKREKLDLTFLMNRFYLKPLTLNELSRLSGRSLSVFKKDFQTEFNTTPALWLKNKRLDYADFLLKNSTKNVSEISTEIGYESVSHFIKTYKSKFGGTPKKITKK